MTELIVGGSEIKITCNKALLGFFSDFFDKACYGPFLEGQTNVIKLPEDNPEDIKTFVGWCYTGSIENSFPADLDPNSDRSPYTGADIERAFRLWILGDKLLAPSFKNAIARKICTISCRHRILTASWAAYVYANARCQSEAHLFMKGFVQEHEPWKDMDRWMVASDAKSSSTWRLGELEHDTSITPPN